MKNCQTFSRKSTAKECSSGPRSSQATENSPALLIRFLCISRIFSRTCSFECESVFTQRNFNSFALPSNTTLLHKSFPPAGSPLILSWKKCLCKRATKCSLPFMCLERSSARSERFWGVNLLWDPIHFVQPQSLLSHALMPSQAKSVAKGQNGRDCPSYSTISNRSSSWTRQTGSLGQRYVLLPAWK